MTAQAVAMAAESGANSDARRLEPTGAVVIKRGAVAAAPGTRTPEKSSPRARMQGAVPCLQTFDAARQDMLRAWIALQRVIPNPVIADELASTISALRQIAEVSWHDERKR